MAVAMLKSCSYTLILSLTSISGRDRTMTEADNYSDDGQVDDNDVMTLMEAMGFSRVEAVSLLRQYDSIEEVFAVLLP